MKIISLLIVRREPFPATVLVQEHDLSSFSFFQRTSYAYFLQLILRATRELLSFFATTLVEKTTPGVYQAVQQDGIGCFLS